MPFKTIHLSLRHPPCLPFNFEPPSTGWCRICELDCETVEGLEMHSQNKGAPEYRLLEVIFWLLPLECFRIAVLWQLAWLLEQLTSKKRALGATYMLGFYIPSLSLYFKETGRKVY